MLISVSVNLRTIEINPLKFIVRDSVLKKQRVYYFIFLLFFTSKTVALNAFVCFYECVDVEIVAAEHLYFLYEVEIVKAECNVLYNCWQRHRQIDSCLVDRVTVFGNGLGNRVNLPELNSYVGVNSCAVGWFNILAFEYVYYNLISLSLNLRGH